MLFRKNSFYLALCLFALESCAPIQVNRAEEPHADGYPIPIPPPPTELGARSYLKILYSELLERLGAPTTDIGDDLVREVEYKTRSCRLYFLLTNRGEEGLRVFQAAARSLPVDRSFPFSDCESAVLKSKM